MSKEVLIRYAKSTLVTFLSGFLTYLAIAVEAADSFQSIEQGALVGAVFAGTRLLPKLFLEFIDGTITKK